MPVSRSRKPKNRKSRGIKPPKTKLSAIDLSDCPIRFDEPANKLIVSIDNGILKKILK